MNKLKIFYAVLAAILVSSIALFLGVLTYEVAHTSFALRLDADRTTEHVIAQVDGLNLPSISTKLDKTLDTVNATAQKEQDALDADNIIANAALVNLDETLGKVNELVSHVDTTQDNIGKSATTTLGALDKTLGTVDTTVAAAKPVLDNAATATKSLNEFVTAPDLKAVVTNTATITYHAGQITATADAVTKKATHDYLDPKPKTFSQKLRSALSTWLPIVARGAAGLL